MGIRRWRLLQPDGEKVRELREATGFSELLCRVLAARGIGEHAGEYGGESGELDDPYAIRDMDRAVERIREAMESGQRIAVYGDYDCDGVTSTALLTSYFQSVGADVIYYVPNRETEGYGLNIPSVEMLHGQGVDLIVTVDNGISAHREIARAAELGMDVVVTDHHTPRDTLPEAVAVVNPHRPDCGSAFKDLAGVGVAFKLICALEDASGSELLEYYSDLVTLGTVADVVPLLGENRAIVRHGLKHLKETQNPGIQALLEVGGLVGKDLTSESVAFGIAPRINAAGRIGVADDAIELLLTDDGEAAAQAAEEINALNDTRKKTEEKILEEIDGILAEKPQILYQRVLVMAGQGWHHGVVGIACAKLVERYHKPCILFSMENGEARGSGRSVEGFSLIEAIAACSGRLTQYGGHNQAAGLTLPAGELGAFEEELLEYAKTRFPVMPVPEYVADCCLTAGDMTVENIGSLSRLEPFGCGNESPLFLLRGVSVDGIYPTSDQKHIRIRFGMEGRQFYAVYFRMTEDHFPYQIGERVDLLAKVSAGTYNGKPQVSVRVQDLRPLDLPQEDIILGRALYESFLRGEALSPEQRETLLPTRECIGLVYRYIKKCGTYRYGEEALFYRLRQHIRYPRMLVALDVLAELGFLERREDRGEAAYQLVPGAPRADLEQSRILNTLKDGTLVSNIG